MIRRASDGRQSLIDLIAALRGVSKPAAHFQLKRLVAKGIVPRYETLTLAKGQPTPIVTDSEWADVRSHLPSDAYLARSRKPDDLYVMQYSTGDAVKIGRSRDVEKRRRSLESGHNFFVALVAVFPAEGHLESLVHKHLQIFRSTTGAGKEWFNVSKEQAITVIQFVQNQIGCQTSQRTVDR